MSQGVRRPTGKCRFDCRRRPPNITDQNGMIGSGSTVNNLVLTELIQMRFPFPTLSSFPSLQCNWCHYRRHGDKATA